MTLKLHSKKYSRRFCAAFTLIELLVVMAVMALMASLAALAIPALVNSGSMNQSVNGISLLLEQARTYAMANHTYVWIGFQQDTNQNTVNIAAVSGVSGQETDINSNATYKALTRIQTFPQIRLATINGLSGMAANPDDIINSSGWTFQQKRGNTTFTFQNILEYNPQGEASIGSTTSSAHWIQVGLQQFHGATANTLNIAALQVGGLTGQVRIFRP